jgi:DNA-binding response OmpR family regulator
MSQHKTPHNIVKKRKGDKKNVLIIEDNSELAILYKQFLSGNYNVEVAQTGVDGIDKADSSTHVILLDRDLPDMNGGQALRELRNNKAITARIAILTGKKPDEGLLNMPVDDYQTKPIREKEINSLVKALLLRDLFQDVSEDLFKLTSKCSALQQVDKTHSEEYNEITDMIEKRRDQIEDILNSINNHSIFRSFPS